MARKKTNGEFTKEVYELVGNEYVFLEGYINNATKIKCRHNICGHEWAIRPNNFLNGKRCPKCFGSQSKTTSQFVCEVYELVKNEYIVLGEYVNAHTKIKIKHNDCGYEWDILPNSFLNGARCPRCAGLGKPIYQEVKHFVEVESNSGCKLLSKEYKNFRTKMLFKCGCGNEFETTLTNFQYGNKRQCNECGNESTGEKLSFTYEEVNNFIEFESNSGCKLISREYNDCKEKLDINCKCGNSFKTTFSEFKHKNKRQCNECSGKVRKDTNYFKQEVYNLVGDEYEVIGEYTGAENKIKIKHNVDECNKYEWDVFPNNILRGCRCPKCGGVATKTTEQFKQEVFGLVEDEYSVLGEYVNNSTKIKIIHNICDYTYGVRPSDFLNGNRCPQCAESKGEQRIRKYLISNSVKFKQEYSFDDLFGVGGGLLRFDFAIFNNNGNINSLIEYDGEFHYKNIYEDGSFEDIQIHDQRKNQYCKDSSIPLLRIPYWKFNDIENILNEWLVSKIKDIV